MEGKYFDAGDSVSIQTEDENTLILTVKSWKYEYQALYSLGIDPLGFSNNYRKRCSVSKTSL